MNTQEQDIVVKITKIFKGINVNVPRFKRLVKSTCNRFKLSKAMISIAIVGNAEIVKLNERFLSHDRSTDCLSFDLSDDNVSLPKWFELVVNAEKAIAEAKLRGHSNESELALYVTHGLLHNLGFDDSTKGQAQKMHNIEDEILQQSGFGLVYNKSTKE